jgi:RimJ/RimL family protein N-acetyltransferase
MGKQKYRRFAVSLRDHEAIVGGIVGEVWMTVLFIQFFWIEERFRGRGHGTTLIERRRRREGSARCDPISIP